MSEVIASVYNDIMEGKINGPTIDDFRPEAAILHWLNKGKGTRHVNGQSLKSEYSYLHAIFVQ